MATNRPSSRPSRRPQSRVRRIAGQDKSEASPTGTRTDGAAGPKRQPLKRFKVARPKPTPAGPETVGPLSSPRLTRSLVIAAVILAVVLAALGSYLIWSGVDQTPSAKAPIAGEEADYRSAADVAAKSVETIFSLDYKTYDKSVDEATDTMTDGFAEEYEETRADIRDKFVDAQTQQTAKVMERSVKSSGKDRVEALLFVNINDQQKDQPIDVQQARVLVTMVRTDSGWLVDNVESQ